MTHRSFGKRVGYILICLLLRMAAVVFFHIHISGRHSMPQKGGLLICSNHQSFFDPLLLGLACPRRINALAKKSLFKSPLFSWMIGFLDAIPIDRKGSGLSGIKETIRRLKRGEPVLIFPEGTRSSDGEVGKLKTGFCTLARRGRVALMPIGIDGAYDAWPRKAKLPNWSTIHICFGEILSAELIATLSDEELTAELDLRIRGCQQAARQERLQSRYVSTASPATE